MIHVLVKYNFDESNVVLSEKRSFNTKMPTLTNECNVLHELLAMLPADHGSKQEVKASNVSCF